MSTYLERHEAQVAHLLQYKDRVLELAGMEGAESISLYLTDYAGPHHDIYQRLCDDIGIEFKPEIGHPDPYGDTP